MFVIDDQGSKFFKKMFNKNYGLSVLLYRYLIWAPNPQITQRRI